MQNVEERIWKVSVLQRSTFYNYYLRAAMVTRYNCCCRSPTVEQTADWARNRHCYICIVVHNQRLHIQM